MKIATFNINNINRRLPNLLDWLKSAKPDIVCLQELKCVDKEFPAEAIRQAGYDAAWRGQKTWNGVAILSRNGEPTREALSTAQCAASRTRATTRRYGWNYETQRREGGNEP